MHGTLCWHTGNKIGVDGCKALAQAMQGGHLASLTSLNLQGKACVRVWLHVWCERWRLVREREGDTVLVRMRVWCRHCVLLFRALMQMRVCVCACM